MFVRLNLGCHHDESSLRLRLLPVRVPNRPSGFMPGPVRWLTAGETQVLFR